MKRMLVSLFPSLICKYILGFAFYFSSCCVYLEDVDCNCLEQVCDLQVNFLFISTNCNNFVIFLVLLDNLCVHEPVKGMTPLDQLKLSL